MTSTQWVAGCVVMLGAAFGAAFSTPWAERTFARPELADTANATHSRTCITLGGQRFEWNFPNPPFGTLSCSE